MTDTNAGEQSAAGPENETSTATPQTSSPASAPESSAPDPADHVAVALAAAADFKDRHLRALAEMENLRRRTEREVADARTYSITGFARDVLQIADNMHRALDATSTELRETADAGVKALLEGVELTDRELHKALEKHGVKKLSPLGEKFDPNFHQAMYEVPDASVPSGQVVQVVQAGYKIGERVLRPALVAVAKGGPKAGGGTTEATAGTDS